MATERPTGDLGGLVKLSPLCSVIRAVTSGWPDLTQRPEAVVIATSGGSDSVGLALAVARLRLASGPKPVVVAHYNHRWRGAQSDADADWVSQFASKMGVEFELGTTESIDKASEENARKQRYHFLKQVARRYGSRYVATAHTRDDVVETVLMRLLRGTGMRGLSGIPARRQFTSDITLVRPLLEVDKATIEAALRDTGQVWRTDSTNESGKFTRNWLRNVLLPQLRDRLPHDVDAAILGLSMQATQWSDWHTSLARELAERHVTLKVSDQGKLAQIDTARLLAEKIAGAAIPNILLGEVACAIWERAEWPLQAMGQTHWRHVAKALRATEMPAFELPGAIRVWRDAGNCLLAGP